MIYTTNQAQQVSDGTLPVSSLKKSRNNPEAKEKIWALFDKGYGSNYVARKHEHLGGLGQIKWSVLILFR